MDKDLFNIMEDVIFLKKYTFFANVETEDLKAIAVLVGEQNAGLARAISSIGVAIGSCC